MADKLFRDYFNEKTETGSVPAGGKLLVQTGGATEPQKLDIDLLATVANSVQKTGATDQIIESTLQAEAFIKAGGTSSEFLKADGSVDSTSFLIQNENLAYGQSYLDNYRTRILNDLGTSHPSTSAFELANLKQNDLLQKASLIVTPSATKASKLYAIKPQNASGDLTVVRATTATRVNEDGLIESVAANVPRIDYKDGNGSILVEPQRTNLLLRSEEFDNASWSKTSITITPNQITSPDGTLNADKLENFSNGARYISQNISLTSGVPYTYSFFVKKGIMDWCYLLAIGSTNIAASTFDILNGALGSTISSNITTISKIENYGDGWWRCSITFTPTISTSFNFRIYNADSATDVNTLSGSFNYIYGAQVEQGSNATSYIPTVASTVTRNADVISKTGISDLINGQEGTIFLNSAALANNTSARFIELRGNTVSLINNIFIRYEGFANRIAYSVYSNSALQCNINFDLNSQSEYNKMAFVWALNRFEIWVNGSKVSEDTLGIPPAENFMSIINFSDRNGNNKFDGNVKSFQLYKTALTDTELAALTTL